MLFRSEAFFIAVFDLDLPKTRRRVAAGQSLGRAERSGDNSDLVVGGDERGGVGTPPGRLRLG